MFYFLDLCINKILLDMEEYFVVVLKGFCVSVNWDIVFLDLFFLDNYYYGWIVKMFVFFLLILFVYCEGNVGNWVWDVMLLCMVLLFVDVRLGMYIVEEMDFCFVSIFDFFLLYYFFVGFCGIYNVVNCIIWLNDLL